MYKQVISPNGGVSEAVIMRVVDNAFIPFAPANADYQQYLEWIAEGNTPLAVDEQTEPN